VLQPGAGDLFSSKSPVARYKIQKHAKERTMKKYFLTALIIAAAFSIMHADTMYGAFKVVTKPSGADVTLYDPDLYLSQTPTPVYPVLMDEYMELREGIPGRSIMLMITKKGYVPLKRAIFVPFTHEADSLAIREPSTFSFELERDSKNEHWRVCVYYGYRHRRPRPPQHVYFHPWYPPSHHHHPGWNPPPPPYQPPIAHPGIIVSGTAQGPGISASGTNSSDQSPGNYKPGPSKYDRQAEPSKYVAPREDKSAGKSEPVKKSTNVSKASAPKSSPSKSEQPQINKSKVKDSPAPKTDTEEEKDKPAKSKTSSKSK